MDVLIVGSIAYDSIESPEGKVEGTLGGSATYAGIACQFHAERLDCGSVGLVGVVGVDFSDDDRATLADTGLDIQGIETAEGETFRWRGSYHGDMAEAETHETHLNVFEHFQPKVPLHARNPKITFCANLHPALQASVLEQAKPSRFSLLDSMNLWIDIAKEQLVEVMREVDIVIINDGEVKMLGEDEDLVEAGKSVMELTGVTHLIVKLGEQGVIAFHPEGNIALPAYTAAELVDPTGCGDAFAGTLAAYLAHGDGELSLEELHRALVSATVTASFTLESFGTEALLELTEESFERRRKEYLEMVDLS